MKDWSHHYTKSRPQCVRYAMAILKDASLAEDVVQDVFLQLLQSDLHPAFIEKMGGYMKTAIRNKCIDHLRRSGRFCALTAALADEHFNRDTEEKINFKAAQTLYTNAIMALPEKGRAVYVLKNMEGLKEKQIALQLGIGLATVTDHLKQSRTKIRTKLRALRA